MSLTPHDISVPVFTRTLKALDAILAKAEAHAEARKIDPTVFLQARLAPDMFPLTRQVQIACDFAKGASARLAGAEVPSWPDDEKTFAELRARIGRTLDFIATLPAQAFAGAETREITIMMRGEPRSFDGRTYLLHNVLPNFFFHAATAYDILRHNGLEIGKRDFIG
ncbi:MAG: DUF1993 domain-containing protein [Alsobacter sp.]